MMPRYLYRCNSCNDQYLIAHAMSDLATDCAKCKAENSLKKMPSSFVLNKEVVENKKVGDEVNSAIKNFKDELEQDKQNLMNREWSPDD